MIARLRDLAFDDSGTAILEYALVMSLVSIVSWLVLTQIGNVLQQLFVDSSAGMASVVEGGG